MTRQRLALICLLFLFAATACSANSAAVPADGDRDADNELTDSDGDADGDVDADTETESEIETFEGSTLLELNGCTGFFGAPNENTGMDAESCGPACDCGDSDFAPVYDAAFVAALREWTLLNPPEPLTEDPYANPDAYPRNDDKFCAVMVEDRAEKSYRLQTFDSLGELHAAGGILTHTTACAKCSSLESLALLIEMPDQTGPIRDCGLKGLTGDIDAVIECLEELGFETPCAQINAYNTRHTTEKCSSICMPLLGAPYQDASGNMNACLQCDEDESGDIFRAVAGRARRNSGIGAAICRPCDGMTHIIHRYE